MSMFLDPEKPLHSCKENSCKGCDVSDSINCHFQKGQLIRFLGAAAPVAIVGLVGVARFSAWLIIVQLCLYFLYFGFAEIRVMCSHCPHYGEPELKSLKCWANYGSPTIWKYRPGPMSAGENIVFFTGMAVIVFFPTVITVINNDYIFSAVYTALALAGFSLLITRLCVQCMNFACPFNRVKAETRDKFFEHNPVIRQAWKDPS